jgi:hypothetical protein
LGGRRRAAAGANLDSRRQPRSEGLMLKTGAGLGKAAEGRRSPRPCGHLAITNCAPAFWSAPVLWRFRLAATAIDPLLSGFLPAEALACLLGDCRFGDTSAPVITPQHPDNRRVFSYGGGGLKVRR